MPDPTEPLPDRNRKAPFAGEHGARDADQARSEADQTLADSDQTAADSDDGASAADEASAYADQQGSDRDQAASDSDQASADRDQADGSTTAAAEAEYEDTKERREYTTSSRMATTARRGMAQSERTRQEFSREQTARRRDESATIRDRVAEQRDRAAAREDQVLLKQGHSEALHQVIKTSEALRSQAAGDRTRAADDRVRAALDREQAAQDRRQARLDIERAQVDALTGVYLRELGCLTLQHEIDRCKRSGDPFVLAFIDIDGLKAINDRDGHAAGDELIKAVAAVLQAELRSYDPIVRIGGDEFLCGFVSAELEDAQGRVRQIHEAVENRYPLSSISIGLAVLGESDTLESLTARADLAMYSSKPPNPTS